MILPRRQGFGAPTAASEDSRFAKLLSIVILSCAPLGALAGWVPGQPLIPCEASCEFNDLVRLGGNLVDFAFYISIPLAAIAFTYAGFLFVTAVGNPGKLTKARTIFIDVAIGFIIVLSAWLLVSVVVNTLVGDSGFSLLK